MTHFDFSKSECFVSVHRAGMLSAVGHDLQLRVVVFNLEGSEEPLSLRAEFRADSLRVVGAVKDGVVNANALSAQDKQEIEKNIREDVLEVSRYPTISFRTTAIEQQNVHQYRQYRIVGLLDLHGITKELRFMAEQKRDRFVAKVSVHQPDFRITPYRAFLGTLRVKPDVQIEVSIPVRTDERAAQ